ncbi:MAG: MMPL family transporter [Deltaproteobacteria bacterium]|nr:MMPL family transporter [Deltaproteobacteria bacterium]
MFEALGRFVYRRRWATLFVSALLLALAVASIVRGGPLTSGNIDGLESDAAGKAVEEITGRATATTMLVYFRREGLDPRSADFKSGMAKLLEPLRKDPRVASVTMPDEAPPPIAARMVAPKQGAAYAIVSFKGGFQDARAAYPRVRALIPSTSFTVYCIGQAPYMHDLDETLAHDLLLAELVSLPLALAVLVFVFRTAVAAALPVAVGALAVASGIAIVMALSHVMEIAQYTVNICSLIGLGVAIDYSLFTVSRYREELVAGRSFEDAIVRTMDRAGRVVAFSGIAVATGLAGLFFFHGSYLFAMGVGGSIVVALGVVFALTLLPALLAVLGPRIHAGRVPMPLPALTTDLAGRAGGGTWHRIAAWVMRRPFLVLLPTLAVLLGLGSPFLHLKMTAADVRVLPEGVQARDGYERLREDFPDEVATHADIVVRFPSAPALDEARVRALFDLSRRVRKLPGVVKVESIVDRERMPGDDDGEPEDPEQAKEDAVALLLHPTEMAAPLVEMGKRLSVGEKSVLLRATLAGPPESETARGAVRAIRTQRAVADGTLVVGGGSAYDIDATHYIVSRAPRAAAFVVVVTFLVLLLLLESVLLPLKAVLMNAVSIAGSFGALVWIFQDGHLVAQGRPLEPALPVLLFCTLFGLSMDYEVLMLSRMKEAWEETHDNVRSVAEGLEKTAGLITSAAAIMVAVFAAFALARVVLIRAVGIGMALAITLDATLVRVLVVPATMRLLGDLNWWAPRFLKWRKRRDAR